MQNSIKFTKPSINMKIITSNHTLIIAKQHRNRFRGQTKSEMPQKSPVTMTSKQSKVRKSIKFKSNVRNATIHELIRVDLFIG